MEDFNFDALETAETGQELNKDIARQEKQSERVKTTETTALTITEGIKALQSFLNGRKAVLSENNEGVLKLEAANLSKYSKITDENQNDARLDIKLANSKIKSLEADRKAITGPLTLFNKEMIAKEKELAKPVSNHVTRVNSLLNGFEAEKERKRKLEEARIQREKDIKIEIARIGIQFKANAQEKVISLEQDFTNGLHNSFSKITLENFEENSVKLKTYKPKLGSEAFKAIFNINYRSDLVAEEDFMELVEEGKTAFPYDELNNQYIDKVQPILKKFIQKLPEKKAELEELARLEKENAEKAAQLRKEKEEKAEADRLEREKKFELARYSAAVEKSQEELNAEVEVHLEQQASNQMIDGPSRKVKYVAEMAVQTNPVEVFTKALKSGYQTKELQTLLQKMVNHLANNGQPKISGVTYKPA